MSSQKLADISILIKNETVEGANTGERVSKALDLVNSEKADLISGQIPYTQLPPAFSTMYKGYLKISDNAPTIPGLYRLLEIGSYNKLIPAVDENNNPTTIITHDYEINEAYFNGTNWVKNKTQLPSSAAEPIFDKTNNVKASTMMATAERYDALLKILKTFITENLVTEEQINMPQSGETSGKFLLPDLTASPLSDYAYGTIPMSELDGYDKIKITGNIGASPMFLGKKNPDNSFTSLLVGEAPNFEIAIDHTAQLYLYSRNITNTKFYKSTSTPIVQDDAVIKYINSSVGSLKGEFYPESYGAEILDPLNPDAGKDCTEAFNLMFQDIFNNYPHFNSYVIIMRGVYRIGGVPNPVTGQIKIPFPTANSLDWNFKTVKFKAVTNFMPLSGMGEPGQSIIPLVGCGFYCSYINTTSTYAFIIRIAEGSHFGQALGNVDLGDIAVYIKNHDDNKNAIKNNMGGINLSNLATGCFGNLHLSTTLISNTVGPDENSLGLYMPQLNNMAAVYGNSLRVQGFGVGAILTEHMNLAHLTAVFNRVGIHAEKTYPINIGNATLEHNGVHCRLGDNSTVNFGVFQTEDGLATPTDWYYGGINNMLKGSGSTKCTINQVMCHTWGGAKTPFKYDPFIRLRYLMDEDGNSKLA